MKKILSLILVILIAVTLFGCSFDKTASSEDTYIFTDSCGRKVEIPKNITRIAPSGATTQMMLYTVAPELLVGLSNAPDASQKTYFDDYLLNLPVFGQFYGGKSGLNMEALISSNPQIIIDIGDIKDTHSSDMDSIQEQTGIPTVFIEANLDTFATAYRTLGELLNKPKQAEEIALYIEEKISMAKENSKKISDKDRLSVMFGTGETGLACNAKGSVQADIIELVGADNAVVTDEINYKNGGNTINMEQLYVFDPDVIIFDGAGAYDNAGTLESWAELSAVKNNKYYEIPSLPYNWMANPPSVNRILGISWLGNLLYPEIYDYDMAQEAIRFYKLFWHYDLSNEEAQDMLKNSTLK